MFHDALYRESGSNDVPETSHPHIPFINVFGAKHIDPFGGLDVERKRPILGKVGFVDLALGQVAICDVSERNDFLSLF